MKQNTHPEYHDIKATCSCGNIINMKSTLAEPLQLDVCSECHPFYTGKQKLVDTGGRIDKFEKRFGKKTSSPKVPLEEAPVETPEVSEVEEAPVETPEVSEVEEAPVEASDKETK